MKFLSLFSGIGGMDLGLERAGWECIGQVEIDPFCQRVLHKHWPHVPKAGDVATVNGDEFGEFDLLVAGYPCQPFSHSGKRKGKHDQRHLWPDVHRIVCNTRPSLVLLENVYGHLSLGFDEVLRDLAEIGYDAQWDCLQAAAIGAPQARERLFVVAYPHGEQQPAMQRGGWEAGGGAFASAGAVHALDAHRRAGAEGHWLSEPDVGRVVDGVPDRVDRLRALGNAVVPQVAEFLGERLAAMYRGDA